jgi:predicted TIM-barrel fold metal-dependent hydrolase
LIELATAERALIFQHTWLKVTGNLPGESTPMDLAELAATHPEADLVCGHAGGDWELGLRVIRSQLNIYADLAGGDPTAGITEMAVRELGAHRVMYGSDVGGRSFASQLGKVFGAELPTATRQLIFSGNLRRLLQPILTRKGLA